MTSYTSPPRSRLKDSVRAVGLVVAVLFFASGCAPGGDSETSAPVTDAATSPPPAESGPVSLAEAEAAALAAVGDGTVTWSGPEDDRGAAWEVEITRPDGSEVDVLVAADGSIVKLVPRLGEEEVVTAPPAQTEGSAPVTLAEAEAIALAAVGEGRVTWSGPEDDRGAAWEIEITRPNGSEVDVLVAADGSIVD